eukprot:scaffold4390_cov264-Pinguiococcus_pyrenoidosus.AAC.12
MERSLSWIATGKEESIGCVPITEGQLPAIDSGLAEKRARTSSPRSFPLVLSWSCPRRDFPSDAYGLRRDRLLRCLELACRCRFPSPDSDLLSRSPPSVCPREERGAGGESA